MRSIFGVCLAVVLGSICFFTPAPVKAQSGPVDCTNGCDVVTCNATVCTVYHCENGGCWIVGSYTRSKMPENVADTRGHPRAFAGVCDITGNKPCAVKTCTNGTCTISLYDKTRQRFVPIGKASDVDDMIKRANSAINHQ